MANRSPGRRRIVIRSTAGSLLDVRSGKSGTSESSNVRMAIRARADSDTRSFAATSANRRFSCGVGRAVIDGAVDFAAPSFTARDPVLRQIADTSLSCLDSHTDPTTLLDVNNKSGSMEVASANSLRRSNHFLSVGIIRSSAERRSWCASANGRRDRTASRNGLTDVLAFLISASIASADAKRRQPVTTLGRMPTRNNAYRLLREMRPRRARVSSIEYNARSITSHPPQSCR